MKGEIFKGWFVGILFSLEEGLIIMMDYVSCHAIQANNPCSNWHEIDIIEWWCKKGILLLKLGMTSST